MRNQDHRVVRHAESLRAEAGRLSKGLGDHRDGGFPAPLGLDPVVETPRRAGPSVRHPVDDDVALLQELVQGFVGKRDTGVGLPPDHDAAGACLL